MKSKRILTIWILALGLIACLAAPAQAEPMGTAWTYQGRLLDANGVADGLYDFEFRLYDDPNDIYGDQVGGDVNVADVDVIDGYFTVELDFNDTKAFNGEARWLEIVVRVGDSNNPKDFVTLSPRQEVTPIPYALYAKSADWGNLNNIPLGFADGIDDIGSGDITSVIAGAGLNGGGSSGDVTLSVSVPLELISSELHPVINVENTAAKGRGILAHSSGAAGYGVKGLASHTTGVSTGVFGESRSGSGSGVYGYASATGAVTNTGGYFEAEGDTGRGVYSQAWGIEATGVYGYASSLSGTNYGIYGKTDSNEGYAGYFEGKTKVTGDLIIDANVGIGTDSPNEELEIYRNQNDWTDLRLNNPNGGTNAGSAIYFYEGGMYRGYIAAANSGNNIALSGPRSLTIQSYLGPTQIRTVGDYPVVIQAYSGNVGIGTTSPGAKLDVTSTNSAAATIGAAASTASGIHSVALGANADANSHYSIAMGTDTKTNGWYSTAIGTDITVSGRRSVGIGVGISRANISSDNVMAIMGGNVGIGTTSPAGVLDVNGPIYQSGNELHADYVFEPDYLLESIEEHSRYMWEKKHLKAIPGKRFDESGQEIVEVGAHRKGIVEELEKAHIYIEQLHKHIKELESKNDTLEVRLTTMEDIVAKLAGRQKGVIQQ